MKKILVDAYLAKNLGDDLFLKVIFERYCNVEWTVIVTQIEYKHIFKEFKNVNIIYINKFFRGLKKYNIFDVNTYYKRARNYDALVFIGGSIFMQKNNYLELYKYRREIIDNFKENNKPVFILGANFGPFKDKEFLNNYKNLFSQCEDVCFREEYSFSLFKELKNIRVSPDIIFGMQSNNIKKEKGTIGFSLINLEKREELAKYQFFYDNKIKELIELYIYIMGKK